MAMLKVFQYTMIAAGLCLSAGARCALAGEPGDLSVTVKAASVAPKFLAYVGGGANINAPEPIGGGGGIPAISFGGGSAFMAGEVSSNDPKTKLLRITLSVNNKARDPTSFKIGDVKLVVGTETWTDFMAVGYNTQLCSMGDEDRKKVKAIIVTVQPGQARTLSYIFPITSSDAKGGELTVSSSPPAVFKIAGR